MELIICIIKQILEFSYWEIIADLMLFLSAFLLLINLAPRDLLPNYQYQKQAMIKLKSDMNIINTPPKGIRITTENSGMSIVQDEKTFFILRDMARNYSPNSKEIDWNNIIGLGYSVLSAPVGKFKVDMFKPLYVVEIPKDNATILDLKPIGQLDGFEKWFSTEHASSVNIFAIIFLFIGFAIQLSIGFGWLGR